MSIDVNIDYAADDSCQIKLWAKGHHSLNEFLTACEAELKHWDDRVVNLSGKLIRHAYWRTVKAESDNALGADFVHMESKEGKGAYKVTELIEWLPLFTT